MVLDRLENYKIYSGLGSGIEHGLEILRSGKLNSFSAGKHAIDGEKLYAIIQEYNPCRPAECKFESHRKYIDIQCLITGSEVIGYCGISKLKIETAYDEEKDVILYSDKYEHGCGIIISAGEFAVFYPDDAHMPMLAANGQENEKIKKIVLKIRMQ